MNFRQKMGGSGQILITVIWGIWPWRWLDWEFPYLSQRIAIHISQFQSIYSIVLTNIIDLGGFPLGTEAPVGEGDVRVTTSSVGAVELRLA